MDKPDLLNGLTLAYMGDAAFEIYIRHYLIEQGLTKPNDLHRAATRYVSARAQASIINAMSSQKILTEKEEKIFKRGRNAKSYSKAKNVDAQTYQAASGFESVLGYVYLKGDDERLTELCQWSIQFIEEEKDE